MSRYSRTDQGGTGNSSKGTFATSRALVMITGLLAVMAASGCTGYRLGTTLPPGIKHVYVPTFLNQSDEPELASDATRATVQEFQRDGTLTVTGPEEADTILEVVITGFELTPLRYERDRAKTTSEYRMRIFADVVFRRAGSDEVLFHRALEGRAEFDFTGDLATSKDEALPLASKDLAHDIVESIVEYW